MDNIKIYIEKITNKFTSLNKKNKSILLICVILLCVFTISESIFEGTGFEGEEGHGETEKSLNNDNDNDNDNEIENKAANISSGEAKVGGEGSENDGGGKEGARKSVSASLIQLALIFASIIGIALLIKPKNTIITKQMILGPKKGKGEIDNE